MQSYLQKVSEEHGERTWLQTGKNTLSERLSGEKSLPEVAKVIIDCLAAYVKSFVGYEVKEIALSPVQNYCHIAVADNGIGFDVIYK